MLNGTLTGSPTIAAKMSERNNDLHPEGVNSMRMQFVVIASAVLLSAVASSAASDCPPAVAAAVQKAHAGVAIASCKQEKENGTAEFEVKLVETAGKRIELDVAPDGTILMTEQSVAVGDVPAAVMKAFAAKYGATAPARAEMQTSAEGTITYELAFPAGTKNKEATFALDGSFVEEE
jgi:hypothetical protein